MKKSTRNTLSFVLSVIVIAVSVYYYWQDQQEETPIEDDLNSVVIDEEEVEEIIALFKADFNLPFEVEEHQIIARSFYTLSYNNAHEQADWVAYKMYPFPDSLSVKRKDAFRPDTLVIGGSATLADYKRSGYDRGHLAPAKALSYSKEAMRASFFMSNMSPQVGMFNRGIWRYLEAQVYKWSKESDSLYVVTGPILDNPLGSIGENEVSIPRAYYKTIVRFKDGNMSGIGFLLENKKTSESYFDFVTSIDSIEQVTGIDFYYQFSQAVQDSIEINKDVSKFIQPINE